MRLTPSQIAMRQMLGMPLPMLAEKSLEEKLRAGHQLLVEITGQDFGFDLLRWHAHLHESNAGAYKWSNKHLCIPRRIQMAMEDEDWQNAVKNLTATPTDSEE